MGFLAIILAVWALLAVYSQRGRLLDQIDILRKRIDLLERRLAGDAETALGAGKKSKESPEPDKKPKVQGFEHFPSRNHPSETHPPLKQGIFAAKAVQPELTRPAAPKQVKPPAGEPSVSLKERVETLIGENLAIWIGAIALVLAGGYFIKYAYENNLLSPEIRTFLGYALGLGCIGAAEKFRKTLDRVSEGLAATGVGIVFGITWTGVNLLDLFSPGIGFGVMAFGAAAGVILSLRFGPVVAVVGMLGGFLTPVLMNTGSENHIGLFIYLMVLLGGVALIARKTGQYWLLTLASFGINGWALLWLGNLFDRNYSFWFTMFLVVSMLIIVGAGYKPGKGEELTETGGDLRLGGIGLRKWQALVALVLTTYTTLQVPFTLAQWAWVALMGAALMLLERFDKRYLLFSWAGFFVPAIAFYAAIERAPEISRGLEFLVLFGLFGTFSLLAMLFQSGNERKAYWAWLSTANLAFIFYYGTGSFPFGWDEGFGAPYIPYNALALIMAGVSGLFLFITHRLGAGKKPTQETAVAMTPFFLSAVAYLNYIVLREVNFDFLGLVFLFEVLGFLAFERLLPQMFVTGIGKGLKGNTKRIAAQVLFVFGVFWLGAVFVKKITLGDTGGFLSHLGPWGWPWQIEILAVPTILFLILTKIKTTLFEKRELNLLEYLAGFTAFLFIVITNRYFFQGGSISFFDRTGFWEVGFYPVLFAAAGYLFKEKLFKGLPIFSAFTAKLLLFSGLLYSLIFPPLLANPLLTRLDVGDWPIINGLIWIYGPAIAFIFLAKGTLKQDTHKALLEGAAFILVFLFITLEVRQFFTGGDLAFGGGGETEKYAYSITWLLSGLGALVGGIYFKRSTLRFLGLVFVSIATGKIFLYDTASLSGLYRVASFAGLGVSSLGIAWLYRRFVRPAKK